MSTNDREREREAALVAAYGRLPKAEPSAALDAAVLAHARAAIAPKRTNRRWPALLATAATLTLAVGVAWQLREAEDRAEAQRAGEAPAAEGVDAVRARAPAPASPPAPARFEDTAERPLEVREPVPEARSPEGAPPAPASAPAQAPATGAVARKAIEARTAAARRDEVDAGAGESERAEAKVREPEFVPAPPSAAASNASDAGAKAEGAGRRRSAVDPAAREPAPTAIDEMASHDADSPQRQAREAAEFESEPAVVLDEPLPMAEPAPPPAEPMVEELAKPAAAPPPSVTLGATARTPAQWLAAIERLLAAGERERAIEELRRFRAAHPDVELPRTLRDLPR